MGNEAFAFPNDTIFVEAGLEGVAGHQFSNKNLIIGKNGAGKTRFLKAVENYYKQCKDKPEVITLYFPETHSGFSSNGTGESENEVSLYDAVYYDSSLSFKDFLKLAERDGILIFLEVHSLTNGEQPYGQAGYLLLRDKQVKRLFPHAYQKKLPNTFSIEKTNCWVIP